MDSLAKPGRGSVFNSGDDMTSQIECICQSKIARDESRSLRNREKWADAPATKTPEPELMVNIATSGGRRELLARTLKSLSECRLPAGYVGTVVAENGPYGGAADVVNDAPDVLNARYMHVPRANKSAALNAMLKASGDCLIFYTDDDVRLSDRTLWAYSDAARRRGPGSFFGGPLSVDYDSPPPRWLREYLPNSAKGWELKDIEHRVDSATFLGGNWAAFAEDLRFADGFNTNEGPGSPLGGTGEEMELQGHLLQMGLSAVYVPTARVWHYVPPERCSPQWTIKRAFRHGLEVGAHAADQTARRWRLPPSWIVYRYLKGMVRSLIWSISRNPELRFRAKHRRSYDRGLMSGVLHQYARPG
jgi:GT2 family glycosyltransferase